MQVRVKLYINYSWKNLHPTVSDFFLIYLTTFSYFRYIIDITYVLLNL